MKIDDMISERGEFAFEKAVLAAVTKAASVLTSIAAHEIDEKDAMPDQTHDDLHQMV
jgi:hypothetical protein